MDEVLLAGHLHRFSGRAGHQTEGKGKEDHPAQSAIPWHFSAFLVKNCHSDIRLDRFASVAAFFSSSAFNSALSSANWRSSLAFSAFFFAT